MTQLSLSHQLVAGTNENINDVQDNFDDIAAWANGNVDQSNIAADGVGNSELADDAVHQANVANNAIGTNELAVLPACRVYNSANQTLSDSTTTTLSFNSERFDTNAIHDTSTNSSRLTCQTAGVYSIFAQVGIVPQAGVALLNSVSARILLNGTKSLALNQTYEANTDLSVYLIVHTIASLAAADYVQVQAFQDSSGGYSATVPASDATSQYGCEFGMAFLTKVS
jgi:hypothetical protein